jgi:hypothetical protein
MRVKIVKPITVYNPDDFIPYTLDQSGEEVDVEEILGQSGRTMYLLPWEGNGILFSSKESLFSVCFCTSGE